MMDANERTKQLLDKFFAHHYAGREAKSFRHALRRAIEPVVAAALSEATSEARLAEHKLGCVNCRCCLECQKDCERGAELRANLGRGTANEVGKPEVRGNEN